MDKNYLKSINEITLLQKTLERLLKEALCDSLEDNKACNVLERLTEELDSAARTLKHYSKPVKEGRLYKQANGRFIINDNELSSGHSLEVWNDEYQKWETGRVEYSDSKGGYYFYNLNMKNPALYNGMKARIRV